MVVIIMGIKERKEREKRSRRKTIVEAAKRIIEERGVEGMSMNHVAGLTELNKATLYLYFRNKDDLIDAVVLEGLALLEKRFTEMDGRSASGLEKVKTQVGTILDFYREHPVYFHAMNHQERRTKEGRMQTPFSQKGNEVASRIFEQIHQGVQMGIEDGSIRSGIDADMFSVLVYAHTYGVMHTIHAKEDIYVDILGVDSSNIEKSAMEFIVYYLKA